MTRALTVWWDKRVVGSLSLKEYGEPEFGYALEWLERRDALPISISLPLQTETFSRRESLPFFEGLLPEESQRQHIAQALGVSHQNAFKLLVELGGEIAGALSLWPEGVEPPVIATTPNKPLSDKELAKTIEALPLRPMLAGTNGLRLSLAGAQSKLPVVYKDGRVSLPAAGEPTTHIIKPPISRFEGTTENEAFCMRLAEAIGLSVAPVDILEIGSKACLLVARYDRVVTKAGETRRLHQEDFAQALGFTSARKYAGDGGPRLNDCFDLVRQATTRPAREVLKLLDAVIFNVIIGNADAHSKNYSLLYTDEGIILAPLYDLLSTVAYPELSPKFAMKVAGRSTLDDMKSKDVQALARQTGLTAPYIRQRIEALSNLTTTHAPDIAAGFDAEVINADLMKGFAKTIAARAKQFVEVARGES